MQPMQSMQPPRVLNSFLTGWSNAIYATIYADLCNLCPIYGRQNPLCYVGGRTGVGGTGLQMV
jgi:hypothetical protein